MTNQDLIAIGFKTLPHPALGKPVHFDLGRYRFLSASSVGTPNEFLYIYEVDDIAPKKINDLICLHNYDYDGKLTIEKVQGLINLLTKTK